MDTSLYRNELLSAIIIVIMRRVMLHALHNNAKFEIERFTIVFDENIVGSGLDIGYRDTLFSPKLG